MENLIENPVVKAILSRSSIRAYSKEPLSKEQLDALKKAALASPTAMNLQKQRFVFVTCPDCIAKLNGEVMRGIEESGNEAFAERVRSRGGQILYSPPLFVAIFAERGRFAEVNAGIAVENLALAAKGLGLESVILGMPEAAFHGERGAALAREIGVPDGMEFMIGISIGYPAAEKTPHEWDESHIIEIK